MEPMTRTLVAFHAHPDDEALLTSGTMAKAAAEGHRVVLVIATDGALGLASDDFRSPTNDLNASTEPRPDADSEVPPSSLADVRLDEARKSAEALGVARVEWLGYADSGHDGPIPADPPGQVRFCRAPIEEAAERLAAILRTERADVLLTYDAAGGYGHRDHVRVHEVGARAAEIARETSGTALPRVLEATVPRDTIARAIRLVGKVYRFPDEFDPTSFERAFTARADITHRINVRQHIAAKRASMRAHASQASNDGSQSGDRTLAAFLRIPRPLYDLVFGREWFRDPDAAADDTGTPHATGADNVKRAPGIRTDVFEGLP
ncbi:PIG-L deacetylase family protein [Knoellia subterranea]|uniref:GlcNAc-PI de-N-acetylase n=1 Tax=Knoellia subterranea KCTC 19937 TaxID=1385521 RepID=A0A0A0JMQ6_9MICO|nr:PIG-L family deacetylase [Knoellia subterranea]KGN37352.1 GlcNAc-PI de-N-acetylase [Knoellia subterranea KCTC 19937]